MWYFMPNNCRRPQSGSSSWKVISDSIPQISHQNLYFFWWTWLQRRSIIGIALRQLNNNKQQPTDGTEEKNRAHNNEKVCVASERRGEPNPEKKNTRIYHYNRGLLQINCVHPFLFRFFFLGVVFPTVWLDIMFDFSLPVSRQIWEVCGVRVSLHSYQFSSINCSWQRGIERAVERGCSLVPSSICCDIDVFPNSKNDKHEVIVNAGSMNNFG